MARHFGIARLVLAAVYLGALTFPSASDDSNKSPTEVVQRQVEGCNRRDVDDCLASYSPDTLLVSLNLGSVLLQGRESLRQYLVDRFEQDPDSRAELVQRISLGSFVVDHERTTGDSRGDPRESIVIYEVDDGLIVRKWVVAVSNDNAATAKAVAAVEAQIVSYNARDLKGFSAEYSSGVQLMDLGTGEVLVNGMEQFNRRYRDRFTNSPDLHAEILSRIVLGNFVVDREQVVRRRGDPTVNAVAVYEVRDDQIQRVWFLR